MMFNIIAELTPQACSSSRPLDAAGESAAFTFASL